LLAVVVIAPVLGCQAPEIVAPTLRSGSARDQCRKSLEQASVALHVWAGAHDGAFPASLDELRSTSENMDEWLVCPARVAEFGYDYVYLPGAFEGDELDKPILLDRPANHPDGGHVLYASGRIEWKSEAELRALMLEGKD